MIKGIQKLDLAVKAQSGVISYDSLLFDSFPHGYRLELITKTSPGVAQGDIITGLFNGGEFFSSRVTNILPGKGQRYIINARESFYSKLRSGIPTVTWVKTSLHEVLGDLLEMAGCEEPDYSSCPDIEIRHLSTGEGRTALAVINHLVRFVELSGEGKIGLFPGAGERLYLGPAESLKTDSGIELKTGENLLLRDKDRLTATAQPVHHNQTLKIDGSTHLCNRSILSCRSGHNRLYLEVA